MKPDGHCFFRALSYQLFGTEDQHIIVRTTLYRTVALNKTIFEPHHMNETSIEDHLKAMASNTWATQVEVWLLLLRLSMYQSTITRWKMTTHAGML